MAAAQELEAQKANIKTRLAEIRAEVRNAGKRARRQQGSTHVAKLLFEAGAKSQCPNLSSTQQAEILMLLELTSPLCTDVAVSYVLGQGREDQHKCPELDEWDPGVRQAISVALDILYLSVDFALVVNALDGKEYHQKKLTRYLVEYKLFHWMVSQNCDQGVYPGPQLVFEAASRFVPQEAPQLAGQVMKSFFLSGCRGAGYWLVSFMQRWGSKIGIQEAGEDLEPGLLEEKVPWLYSGFCLSSNWQLYGGSRSQ